MFCAGHRWLAIVGLMVSLCGCAKGSTTAQNSDGAALDTHSIRMDSNLAERATPDTLVRLDGGCSPACEGVCAGASDGCGGTCPITTCAGCCDGTQCKPGGEDSSCGVTGSACLDCDSGTAECGAGSCVAGQCQGTAAPEGTPCTGGVCHGGACCTGCWDGSTCHPGTAVGLCGGDGGACQSCADGDPCTSDACSGGTCQNPDAPAGTPCSGGTCKAGECCTGCWSSTVCKSGTDLATCGSGGIDCTPCAASHACEAADCSLGTCEKTSQTAGAPCPGGKCPLSGPCCTGCLDTSNGCQTGDTNAACGDQGAPCVACLTGRICDTDFECSYPLLTHDGCSSVVGRGCGGCPCEVCVCQMDPYCCDTKWDTLCADECDADCGGPCP